MSVWEAGGNRGDRQRLLERIMDEWPEEEYASWWYINVSMYDRAEFQRARAEKALAVAPLTPGDRILWLAFLGRLYEALDVAKRRSDERPDAETLMWLALVERWRGDGEAALAAARRSVEMDSTPIGPWQWLPFVEADALEDIEKAIAANGAGPSWLALRGRWREALAELDARAPARTPRTRGNRHRHRAVLLALAGADAESVWREVENVFRAGGARDNLAWLLALSGDVQRGELLLDDWAPFGSSRVFKALRRWKSGERERAICDLESVFGYTSTFYRARILAELGRDREAADTFRRFRRTPDMPLHSVENTFPGLIGTNYALSLYHEAVSLDRLGERDEARRLLNRLLRLWNRADASQPMLREAKALRLRLAAAR
jgi:tetratricopeptide (TPR) repeat protein